MKAIDIFKRIFPIEFDVMSIFLQRFMRYAINYLRLCYLYNVSMTEARIKYDASSKAKNSVSNSLIGILILLLIYVSRSDA